MAQLGEPGGGGKLSAEERERHELAASYLAKKRMGQKPTRAEIRAYDRLDQEETERRAKHWIQAVPKGVYCEWAKRKRQVVLDHAKAYGLPCDETTVNVPELIHWFHAFLVRHSNRLPALLDSENLLDEDLRDLRDKSLQKQIEVMERKISLLDMDIADRASEMLPRTEVHEILGQLAQMIRAKSEVLGRQFGNDAVRLINELGDDVEKYVAARMGDTDGSSS